MMKTTKTLAGILAALLLAPLAALAAGGHVKLDRAPVDLHDAVSLQRGAKVFVNYCLNCHGAQYMRYNRLTDLGLTEEQIRDNLMFAGDKVGQLMKVAMTRQDGGVWFGAPPPDLSVIARSRGADWLYTYLRTYYRDPSRATGWNNLAFPQVGMPHVLWELQGIQELKEEKAAGHGEGHVEKTLVLAQPGKLSKVEYDVLVGDLVNYLVYMGEPAAVKRSQIGIIVILFLGVLFVLAYLLKKEYWKDVH
jgi:ubiquinol-cytochrome c reductase cytochrome c1 subunit